jgi:hypothetical protein
MIQSNCFDGTGPSASGSKMQEGCLDICIHSYRSKLGRNSADQRSVRWAGAGHTHSRRCSCFVLQRVQRATSCHQGCHQNKSNTSATMVQCSSDLRAPQTSSSSLPPASHSMGTIQPTPVTHSAPTTCLLSPHRLPNRPQPPPQRQIA